jgi:hypothetical protein
MIHFMQAAVAEQMSRFVLEAREVYRVIVPRPRLWQERGQQIGMQDIRQKNQFLE